MCRPGVLTALVAFAFTVAAMPAGAQYRPPPPPPEVLADPAPPEEDPDAPEDDPEASPDLEIPGTIATGGGAGWGWEKYLSLDGVWESNVGFTSPSMGGDFFGALTGSATRWRRTPRSEWTMTLNGAGFVYAENSQLNRIDAAAATTASKMLNSRVSLGFRAGYSYGHTDTDYALAVGGTVLPPSRMQTADVGTGVSWHLNQRTELSLDASWRDFRFESERLQDSNTLTTSATLTRRLSTRNTAFFTAMYRRTEDRIIRHDPGVSVGFRRLLIPSLAFDLEAGANRSTLVELDPGVEIPERWFFAGGAGLTGYIRRSVLVARYRHRVDPTVGFGIVERTDLFTLTATVPIGRFSELIGTGSFASRGDPNREGVPRRHDLDFYVGVSTRLSRRTQIVAGYRFRRRDDRVSEDPIHNDRASVSLVWGPEVLRTGR